MSNEFNLINYYFNYKKNIRNDVILGIGDDCALLSLNKKKYIAVSTDTLVAGIHFLHNINPSDLAFKSLASNLSDLASMGAEPSWLLLALTIPKINKKWLKKFSHVLFKQLNFYKMQLIGGDTTKGPLSITITIHGLIPYGQEITRKGAKINDLIYVTGTLGDSAAGLEILQNKLFVNNKKDRKYLLNRHLRPIPRIYQGQILRKFVSSAIDISDGTIMDLNHILNKNKCGAIINLEKIPISKILLRNVTIEKALNLALNGGEDYELCFTVPEVNVKNLNTEFFNSKIKITCIGKICSFNEGIKFIYNKKIIKYKWNGYDHFKLN